MVAALTARTRWRTTGSRRGGRAAPGRRQAGQDGLEAFATDAVGGFPEDDQCFAHRLVVGPPSHDWVRRRAVNAAVEQSDGVLAMAAGHGDELVEDLALILLGGLLIALTQRLEEFALRLLADLVVHRLPPECW